MAKSNMDQDILKVLLTEEEIKARVEELGSQLYDRFAGEDPLFVGVLNGCFIFMADLVRAAQLKSELEFIGLSSYQDGTKSSGVVQIYAGFVVPDEFVVGYGLDYAQQYRNMPYIGVLKPEVYSK